jgi:hypothetical protein
MVSETLAQYSAMMVLETAYGTDMARRFYDYNLTEYLRGRSVFTNREAPLLDGRAPALRVLLQRGRGDVHASRTVGAEW